MLRTKLRPACCALLFIFSGHVAADTFTIPFAEIQQAIDASGDSPDAAIRGYLAGLLRDELSELGFDVDGGLVLDDIPLEEMTERIADDCPIPRPYKIHTDATTATVTLDDNSSLTVDLDSIRSVELLADLDGVASADTRAWVRWGQDILFFGDCVRLNTDHGWIGVTLPFSIEIDLAIELNPSYDSEQLAIVIDKHATLTAQVNLSGGSIDHEFGPISLTDLVIDAFEDELLEELRLKAEQEIVDEVTALNYALDGRDENGDPDPSIDAFNGPSTFALDVSAADEPLVRGLLEQYGIPDIVIAMLDDRGIEVLLQLAILEGAEQDAYLEELGALASCEVLLAAFETPLDRVPLYAMNGPSCEVADPDAAAANVYYSDAACASPIAYRPTSDSEFCADRFGPQAESLLGNAASWVADTGQPGDALPGTRSRAWTSLPSTQLDLGAVPLAGNHQPYVKQLGYETISNLPRGNGSCELEMRVYKKDITAEGLKPVLALHGGTWQHRGFSFLGMEAGISQLTERDYIVFAPFYRLVGESDGNPECNGASWREVTADVETALDWVMANGAALGADDDAVNVYGQSAGAHLAAWLAAHRPDDVRKALAFYGPLDALEFLAGAVPADGPYAAYSDFGMRSLARFFGAKDLRTEVRLGAIDYGSATIESLTNDWAAQVPDATFDISGIDPQAPPAFVARCAAITGTDLAGIDPAAPPAILTDCMKQDLAEFLVANSFIHLLGDEAVPLQIVHGTADNLVPYQQALGVCGAIDARALPTEIVAPLSTFACGLSSEAQIIADAGHALELGVCLDSICPAGPAGSATRMAVETAIGIALDWLQTDPIVARDTDGDGVPDHKDAFPDDPSETADTDADGIGDNADNDDDNDGRADDDDPFPLDASEYLDSDGDGAGNNADDDDDNDGIDDAADNCPVVPNVSQADADGNGLGDACDPQFTLVTQVPDLDANGVAEVLVLLREHASGELVARVRDGSTSALLSSVSFGTDPVVAIDVVADLDGSGSAELAVLSTRADGRSRVQVRDARDGTYLADMDFGSGFTGIGLASLPDADSDGVAEIAVLATRDGDGRSVVEIRNVSGAGASRFLWFAAAHTPIAIAAIPGDADGDGVPEIAVLSSRHADGRNVVEVKNAAGAVNTNAVWFMAGTSAIDLAVIDDKDANGIPELAVLARRDADGRNVVEIKNAAGPKAPSALWFAAGHTALAVAGVGDRDGNGVPEVAVLSTRNDDGRNLVEVKNAAGAINPNGIWYSPGFAARGLAMIGDTDYDGVEEALVLMVRDSDGRIVVQGRNVAGLPAARDYWYKP